MANVVVALSIIPVTIFLLELSNALRTGNKANLGTSLQALKASLTKPLFLGALAGMLVSFFRVTPFLPLFFLETVKIVANACNFISLFAVGVAIYGTRIHFDRTFSVNMLIKCLVAPVIAWGVVLLFHITGVYAEEMIFLFAMPVATMATIVSFQWRVMEKTASSLYMTSTALSLIILPILLVLMKLRVLDIGLAF